MEINEGYGAALKDRLKAWVTRDQPWWRVPVAAAVAGGLIVGAGVGIYAEGKMQSWKSHSDTIAAQRDEARGQRDDLEATVVRLTSERNSARAALTKARASSSATPSPTPTPSPSPSPTPAPRPPSSRPRPWGHGWNV